MARGWAIFDKKRRYIPVLFETEREAVDELTALLKPYPTGHEWRRRLHVDFVEDAPLVRRGEPPYGYRRQEDARYGARIVENKSEQNIVRFVRKMMAMGDDVSTLVKRLNARGWSPRHGHAFTVQQVNELLEERRHHGQEEGAAQPSARAAGA